VTSLSNLAVDVGKQERYAEAEELDWQVLALRERIISDHAISAGALKDHLERLEIMIDDQATRRDYYFKTKNVSQHPGAFLRAG
jgi:hypothetical protein